jgi:solute:Na+ symporter, SSS family
VEQALTTSFSWIDGTIIAIFFGFIVYAGTYFHKWIKNPDDYFVAGRQLTPFILAAALAATNINLYNFQSYVGFAYREGISIVWHEWTGLMCLAFAGVFILPIFRRLRIATIPEFVGKRFSPSLRALIAFLWSLRFGAWLGIVLYLAAQIGCVVCGFSDSVTDLPFTCFVLVFGILTVIFTMAGGMWAVALTDILQFVFLLGGSLIMIPLIMHTVGYWQGMQTTLNDMGRGELLNFVPMKGMWGWKGALGIWLLGMQWASTDQAMLQRAFGAKTIKGVAKGMVYAGLIMVPFAFIIPMPGIAYHIKVAMGTAAPLLQQDNVLPSLLIGGLIPVGILGIVLCGLLASQVSTLDAGLNSAATVFTQDIYKLLFKKNASDKETLFMLRLMTVVMGVIMILSAYLAKIANSGVELYITIIAVVDLPLFIVAVVYGLGWKRATPAGAMVGYVTGMAFGLIIELSKLEQYLGGFSKSLHPLVDGVYKCYAYLPILGEGVNRSNAAAWDTAFIGMAITALVVPIVSLMTRQTNPEQVEEIWKHRGISDEEREVGDEFHIWPITAKGRLYISIMLLGLGAFLASCIMGKFPSQQGYSINKLEMVRFEQTALLVPEADLPQSVSKESRQALLDDLRTLAKNTDINDEVRKPLADNCVVRMKEMMQRYLAMGEASGKYNTADHISEFNGRITAAKADAGMPIRENAFAGWIAVIGMLVYFLGALMRMRHD